MFKTILLATDGSDLSNKAAQSTVRFAKEHGSKIVGLSVATIYPYFPIIGVEMPSSDFIDAINKDAQKSVQIIATLASEAGVPAEVHVVEGMSTYEEILKAAEKYNCDAIFMASHGRRGLDKLMLGSEAQKILVHSKLPVTIFK